eukprot:Nk52_evm6s744 gene=Nk52_evmTU6s744
MNNNNKQQQQQPPQCPQPPSSSLSTITNTNNNNNNNNTNPNSLHTLTGGAAAAGYDGFCTSLLSAVLSRRCASQGFHGITAEAAGALTDVCARFICLLAGHMRAVGGDVCGRGGEGNMRDLCYALRRSNTSAYELCEFLAELEGGRALIGGESGGTGEGGIGGEGRTASSTLRGPLVEFTGALKSSHICTLDEVPKFLSRQHQQQQSSSSQGSGGKDKEASPATRAGGGGNSGNLLTFTKEYQQQLANRREAVGGDSGKKHHIVVVTSCDGKVDPSSSVEYPGSARVNGQQGPDSDKQGEDQKKGEEEEKEGEVYGRNAKYVHEMMPFLPPFPVRQSYSSVPVVEDGSVAADGTATAAAGRDDGKKGEEEKKVTKGISTGIDNMNVGFILPGSKVREASQKQSPAAVATSVEEKGQGQEGKQPEDSKEAGGAKTDQGEEEKEDVGDDGDGSHSANLISGLMFLAEEYLEEDEAVMFSSNQGGSGGPASGRAGAGRPGASQGAGIGGTGKPGAVGGASAVGKGMGDGGAVADGGVSGSMEGVLGGMIGNGTAASELTTGQLKEQRIKRKQDKLERRQKHKEEKARKKLKRELKEKLKREQAEKEEAERQKVEREKAEEAERQRVAAEEEARLKREQEEAELKAKIELERQEELRKQQEAAEAKQREEQLRIQQLHRGTSPGGGSVVDVVGSGSETGGVDAAVTIGAGNTGAYLEVPAMKVKKEKKKKKHKLKDGSFAASSVGSMSPGDPEGLAEIEAKKRRKKEKKQKRLMMMQGGSDALLSSARGTSDDDSDIGAGTAAEALRNQQQQQQQQPVPQAPAPNFKIKLTVSAPAPPVEPIPIPEGSLAAAPPPEAAGNDVPDETIICSCKNQIYRGEFMVACDKCSGWWHGACVGVIEGMAVDQYVCPNCKKKSKKKRKR